MNDGRGADADVWLPSGAPGDLVDVVRGRTSAVEIDTSEAGWLPLPADVSPFAEASVVIDHGWTPTAVSFEIGWGQFGLASPVVRVVIVDGALTVTTSGLSDVMAHRLSDWAASFNRALHANHRQLDSLRVSGSTLRITTRSPLPAGRGDPAVALPVALAGLWALRRPTAPELPPWTQRSRVAKTLMAVAIVLLCGGGAVVVATAVRDGGGGGDGTSLPSTTARSEPTNTTVTTSGPRTTEVTTTSDVTTTEVTVDALGPEPPTPPADTTITTEAPVTSDVTTTSENRIGFGPEPPPPLPPPSSSLPSPPPPSGDRTNTSIPPELLETCGESTARVDSDADGVADDCEELDYYLTEVALPPVPGPGTFPPGPATSLPRTGSDNNVALQLGMLLIVAGLTAMVAAHRRSEADRPEPHSA